MRLPTGKVATQICKHSTLLYAPVEMKVSKDGGMNFINVVRNAPMYKLGIQVLTAKEIITALLQQQPQINVSTSH